MLAGSPRLRQLPAAGRGVGRRRGLRLPADGVYRACRPERVQGALTELIGAADSALGQARSTGWGKVYLLPDAPAESETS